MSIRVWYHPGWQGSSWSTALPEFFADADDYAIDGAGQLQLYQGETIISTLAPGCWSVVKIERSITENMDDMIGMLE